MQIFCNNFVQVLVDANEKLMALQKYETELNIGFKLYPYGSVKKALLSYCWNVPRDMYLRDMRCSE